jgi:hypothetical protein
MPCRPPNEVKVHLGWVGQLYNAAEALPNLIQSLVDAVWRARFQITGTTAPAFAAGVREGHAMKLRVITCRERRKTV